MCRTRTCPTGAGTLFSFGNDLDIILTIRTWTPYLSRACSMASALLRATTWSLLRPSGDAAAASSLGNTYLQDVPEPYHTYSKALFLDSRSALNLGNLLMHMWLLNAEKAVSAHKT